MKRWKIGLPILAVLGLVVWWTLAGLQGSLLVLDDGLTLAVDEAHVVGDRVFYKQGLAVKTAPQRKVKQIVVGSLSDPTCYQPLLTAHFQRSLVKLSGLKRPAAWADITQHPIYLRAAPHLPWIAGGFLGLLLLLLGLRGWRRGRGRKITRPDRSPDDGFLHLADFFDVETLFLNLFIKKLGAPSSAPAEIEKTPQAGNGPGKVLNLKVHHEGKWQSRRMSLAPIGEGTGSKSQCFYVIFDTHMVVKIPPTPITDFEDYIRRVQAETKIMLRLAPKICVIPNLAVVLRRIHPFPDADRVPPEQLEDRYIRWLRKFPENQRFLTIGGSFVFFMDLARYYFLSHVAAGFHGLEAGLDEEIKADIDILSDLSLFEGKYGSRGGELWAALHKGYESFRQELNSAIAQAEEPVSLSEWNIKQLYLASMAGRDPGLAGLNVPAGFRTLLEGWLGQTAGAGKVLKQRYRQLLNHYTERRLFNRSRPLMGGMVTNLLSLLAWTGEKKIGLRDLKPDNLLVAGNPDDYPHFLTSAQAYAIGLIDLETAVDFGRNAAQVPQPQLGGTPLYCTPSHFFPNVLLERVYQDLPEVFHLQDWYAMIAIIFGVVTGDPLFKGTAYQIPMMMQSVMQTAARKGDLKKKFLHFSRQFQDNAAIETREKFKLHAPRLQAVSAHIPEKIQQQLAAHHQQELRTRQKMLAQVLDSQAAFSKDPNRQRLEKSSVEDLKRLRAGYKKRTGGEKLAGQFDKLIRVRREIETLSGNSRLLEGTFPEVTTDVLLKMMYSLVQSKLLTLPDLPDPDPAHEIPGPETAGEKELENTSRILGYSATINIPAE